MMKNSIDHWMKLVTSREVNGNRTTYRVGNSFIVDVCRVDHDLTRKNDLMRVWKKAGFIKKMFPSHLSISTYFYDANGDCWGYYNIQEKRSDDGKRRVIDFDYIREATEENERELVAECIRLMEMGICLE